MPPPLSPPPPPSSAPIFPQLWKKVGKWVLPKKKRVWGVWPTFQNPTLFMTKISNFPTLFITWPKVWDPIHDQCTAKCLNQHWTLMVEMFYNKYYVKICTRKSYGKQIACTVIVYFQILSMPIGNWIWLYVVLLAVVTNGLFLEFITD